MHNTRSLQINSVSCPALRHILMRADSPFPLFHCKIVSYSSHYLPNYSHSKQPNNISSFYLHLLRYSNNTNVNLCQLDSTLTREQTTFYEAYTICKKIRKIIREYGIMELTVNRCRQWTGNRVYLEWPYHRAIVTD